MFNLSNPQNYKMCCKLQIVLLILLPTLCLKAQEKNYPLGSYSLHATISGSKSPTVVFESGMGEPLSTWKDVQPIISESTRTFSYDRAGLGLSDPSPNPRTARQMASELHRLLKKANVRGPYILVGHSLGGWIIGIFAHLYPWEVAGLVLVDPAYYEPFLKAKASAQDWAERESMLKKYTPPMTKYQKLEKDNLDLSGQQFLKAFPIPKVPTILLTGTLISKGFPLSELEKEVKLQFHRDWIVKVPWTRQVFVPESRHYIQNDAPAKVILAIKQIIGKTRK